MLTFIPSPIDFEFDSIFRAVANKSGRMQYYRIKKGKNRQRISKGEFLNVYNKSRIIAIKPIQNDSYLA
ncbi:MAG: hypothetical protein KAR17_06330, partial [Cyclobacteriaceae bacterium]|nr:hypothetical protein [Cyclobacteriaceae bacterium]